MRQHTIDIFSKAKLRLLDGCEPAAGRFVRLPLAERPFVEADIDRLVADVGRLYDGPLADHAALGRKLCEWLDGASDRWLAAITDGSPGATLHIDVDERLRHLPWELLFKDGLFMCGMAASPFSPVRRVHDRARAAVQPYNRPLRVLFIACSPTNVQPTLRFEDEERRILDAAKNASIELVVEETGSLTGLKERIDWAGPDYFDVLHLTGHADIVDGKDGKEGTPVFIMEDDYGNASPAAAAQIVAALQNVWPRLIFLSGCQTGAAVKAGTLPSLAESIVRSGGPAVLGWALPVRDISASVAAEHLYRGPPHRRIRRLRPRQALRASRS